MLQQLQNVGTQPVFDDLPSFDAKEIHPRILDTFPNRSRRSAWHATLIHGAKDPATSDPFVTGRAVLTATTRFHDPAHAAEWSDPDIDATLDGVWSLILVGLSPRNIPQ